MAVNSPNNEAKAVRLVKKPRAEKLTLPTTYADITSFRRKLGSPIVIKLVFLVCLFVIALLLYLGFNSSDSSDNPTLGSFIVPDGNESESVLSVSEDGEIPSEVVASEADTFKENDSVGVANDAEDDVATVGGNIRSLFSLFLKN